MFNYNKYNKGCYKKDMKIELNLKAKPKDFLPDELMKFISKKAMVGSRFTVSPPPDSTDLDVLVLVHPDKDPYFLKALDKAGWVLEGEYNQVTPVQFTSFRKPGEIVNLITVSDIVYYNRFLQARDVCKILNLKNKDDRIAVHNAVLMYQDATWWGNPLTKKKTYKYNSSVNFAAIDALLEGDDGPALYADNPPAAVMQDYQWGLQEILPGDPVPNVAVNAGDEIQIQPAGENPQW